ncbi:MAG: amidohydrolase family protein [Promethearchaeota archaeon]
MKIIDAHAHLLAESDYLENLLEEMDKCGIEKCCISGLGILFRCLDNKAVKNAFNRYPDRFVGSVFIRPGLNGPADIRRAHNEGFRMVKVTIPQKAYDDASYFPLWEVTQELEMPVLFHTGIVTTSQRAPREKISSWYMHPMRIEPITNAFPDLKIIIAHLGVHWNNDAAELARMRPNVFVDLTGEPDGWRVRADTIGMDKWLWWPGAFKKVVFGTDVHYTKIQQILREDQLRLDKLMINQQTREQIFAGNILRLLGGLD